MVASYTVLVLIRCNPSKNTNPEGDSGKISVESSRVLDMVSFGKRNETNSEGENGNKD